MPVFLTRKRNTSMNRLKRKSLIAQAILIVLGFELLFLSGFTALNLPTATAHNLQLYSIAKISKLYALLPRKVKNECDALIPSVVSPLLCSPPAVRYSLYVPQAPIAIFLGYALGWPLALITAAIYLVVGLIGPFFNLYIFSAGSGLNYYLQPGFGYLLGMVVAAAVVGWLSRSEQRKSTNQLLSLFAGLFCTHSIGLSYLLGICMFGAVYEATGEQLSWSGWLFEEARNLSWYALPYDLLFSLALIGISFPFRWLVAILTAPDIGVVESSEGEKLIDFQLAKPSNSRN